MYGDAMEDQPTDDSALRESHVIRLIQDEIDLKENMVLPELSGNDADTEACIRMLQEHPEAIVFPSDDAVILFEHGRSAETISDPQLAENEAFRCHLTVHRVLGSGGFGVVLAVTQKGSTKELAMKVLRPTLHWSHAHRIRFLREAELTSALDHPGIVRIFGRGMLQSQPFILTELIEGPSLAQYLKHAGGRIEPRVAVVMVRQLCDALRYAHEHGVVHRDLKPENILLRISGTAGIPQPVLTDFGLARHIAIKSQDTRLVTSDHILVGTIRYMAPELATGKRESTTIASDLFSVAAILYQCLTGSVPFEGRSYFEVITRMISAPVTPAKRLNPALPRDLESVLDKALQRSPSQRYRSVAEFSDELDRLLQGKPILARHSYVARAVNALFSNYPRFASAMAVLLTVVPVAMFFISVLYWRERNAIARQREMLVATMESVRDYTYVAEQILERVPASADQRYEALLKALRAQEMVAEGLGYNAESRYRLSVQHSYLSRAAARIGEFQKAQEHYKECLDLLRQLLLEDPDNVDYQYDVFFNRRLEAEWNKARPIAEQIRLKEEVLQEVSRLRELSPENADFEDAEASCWYSLAVDYAIAGDDRAEKSFRKAAQMSDDLWLANPDKLHFVKYALLARALLGDLYRDQKDLSASANVISEAIEILSRIEHAGRDEIWFIIVKREPCRSFATTLSAQQRWSEAINAWEVCLAIEDELEKVSPENWAPIVGRAAMYAEYLRAHRKLGADGEVLEQMQTEADLRLRKARTVNVDFDYTTAVQSLLEDPDLPPIEAGRWTTFSNSLPKENSRTNDRPASR